MALVPVSDAAGRRVRARVGGVVTTVAGRRCFAAAGCPSVGGAGRRRVLRRDVAFADYRHAEGGWRILPASPAHRLLPGEGEAAELLTLMLLTDARRSARTDTDGSIVRLAEQRRVR